MKKTLLAALVVCMFCSCTKELTDNSALPESKNTETVNSGVVPGWVRIKLKEDARLLKIGAFTRGAVDSGDSDLDMLAADLGATEIRVVFPNDPRFEKRHRKYGLHLWFDVKFDEEVPVSRATNLFGALPSIAHVEPINLIEPTNDPDYIMPAKDGFTVGAMAKAKSMEAAEMPFNDPELGKQWHYHNDGSIRNSVAGADINLFKAWEMYGAGNPNVIVAVMDSALQTDHPDLAENVWVNKGEIPDNGIDDDGNGYIDDVNGWNFDTNSNKLLPGSHGTHVAGTIGAVNHNGIGVCGIAGGTGNGDGVKLMTIQMYGPDGGEGSVWPNPASFIYAADNGALISQNSWAVKHMDGSRPVMPESYNVAFDYFIENAGCDKEGNQLPGSPMKGGIIVFATGNSAQTMVGVPSNDPRVIAVAAMKPNYQRAAYSNIGSEVDILAPGGSGSGDSEFTVEGKVYSTDINRGYTYKSGTSMACPHVSGIAALIVSKFGGQGFTSAELKERLLRSTRDVGSYQVSSDVANSLGYGLIDATLIDAKDDGAAPSKPSAVMVKTQGEEKLVVEITVPADSKGNQVSGFTISYVKESLKANQSEWKTITEKNGQAVGTVRSVLISNLADATDYIFRVTAYDRFDNESEYVEAKGRTIDHINRPPGHKEVINPVYFPLTNGGENLFEEKLDLNNYFNDPDLPNDKLTFSAESKDSAIATASIENESILVIKAVKKGSTSVRVEAKDLVGAKVFKTVSVQVKDDVIVPVTVKKEFEPLTLPAAQDGSKVFEMLYALNDYFSGVDVVYSAESNDASIVTASVKDGNKLVVKAVDKGSTDVKIIASDNAGSSATLSLVVTVSEKPQGGNTVDNKIAINPNPVANFAKITIVAAGNSTGQMKIYDLAARMVKRSDVSFSNSTIDALDLNGLAPGVYSMVVRVDGTDYKGTFVKK